MKPSVLIVDDDQSFRTYVTLLLRGREYPVEALENGEQLIARLKSAKIPSVILLDVLLPDSDGIDVIGKIKSIGVSVPVIMLSGVGHVRTVVEAMKLGASDFLMKPFDDSTLEKAISNAIGLSQKPERIAETAVGVQEPDGFV